jgi:SAM-dependent methyltransferase
MRLLPVHELARRAGLGAQEDPWPDYLARFHAERPGVIQEVLSRSIAGQRNPYSWLARAVSRSVVSVADVECGAGALARELDDGRRRVIGIEDSAPELETAMGTGSQFISWVRGSVDNLPLADHSMDAVVTSMGMVTVPDPRLLVDEASRVLRPGGVFACMAPTIRPLPMALARQAAALTARVGSTPSFPGALELRMTDLLAQRGLRKVEDARSCYVFTVRDAADADLIINAMYLPGSTPARRRSARDWLVRRAQDKGQVELPIPMRRVVALKDPEPASAIV